MVLNLNLTANRLSSPCGLAPAQRKRPSLHQATPLWGRFGVWQGLRMGLFVALHREGLAMLQLLSPSSEAASRSLGGVTFYFIQISRRRNDSPFSFSQPYTYIIYLFLS